MTECLFCQIIAKKLDATIVYEDDEVLAFEDINPQAPVHVLFVPKKHISALARVEDCDAPLLAHIFRTIKEFAAPRPELREGYRVVVNNGKEGGQAVAHLHFHLLGGRQMDWPPG